MAWNRGEVQVAAGQRQKEPQAEHGDYLMKGRLGAQLHPALVNVILHFYRSSCSGTSTQTHLPSETLSQLLALVSDLQDFCRRL